MILSVIIDSINILVPKLNVTEQLLDINEYSVHLDPNIYWNIGIEYFYLYLIAFYDKNYLAVHGSKLNICH